MKPKIALIGAGKFGKNHLRVLRELEKEGLCTFYGVVDNRKEILENIRKNYDLETASDLTEFLKTDIDAVDIVTPGDTHFKLCQQCLFAKKHVFVEKPLATNYAEAIKLVQLAAEKNLILAVGLIYRYNAAVRKIKELIDSGELGKVYYMFGHYMGFKEPRTDVGALLNFAVHHIDIYNYLMEKIPEEVTCSVAHFLGRKNFEDFALLFLKYENGTVGIIESSWLPPGNCRDLTIVGSKKSITSDIGKQTLVLHDIYMEKKDNMFKAVDRGTKSIDVKFEEPLKLELKDFLECVKTGRQLIADGHAAAKTIMIAEKALESARLKRSVKISETK
ncbi:Gfo/Idh/MocA family oxidoreductase [Candidatus Bathyarchaeota archaeon]|nr:Gfo/Idh/MocA family oxidoreductase [Candidatus Bathyarchaeota archaeon]